MEIERRVPTTGDQALKPSMDMRQLFVDNITVEGDMLCYDADSEGGPGLYVGVEPATPSRAYFEVELLGLGIADLLLGFLSPHGTLTHQWDSTLPLSCRVSKGRLSECQSYKPGVACGPGDRVGCGLFFDPKVRFCNWGTVVTFFVTHNGKEVGRSTSLVSGRLHPAVVLRDSGQQVRLLGEGRPSCASVEDAVMCVDSNEDDWLRLHDVHLNGPVLEYAGRGTSMIDVGLAQTRAPLSTASHYYELEILDPGEKCCIAIGLAHRDYPRQRHPGWNGGSIAYHADDGKIFVGSGVGSRFGPKCQKGDIMGCGILFPPEYEDPDDSFNNDNRPWALVEDDEEYDFWRDDAPPLAGTSVQVFFTLNGVNVGRREVAMPKGGLYPTVGMLSCREKVKVDLHPLTG